MLKELSRALRFTRSWASPAVDLEESEVLIPGATGGEPIPGTVVSRAGSREQRGWVVLHGMTRPGRKHSELLRFVRGLASTGARVLVPEIREWIELRFAPERAQEILRVAASWLHDREGTAPGGVVLVGFSFGAPQALLAASDPTLSPKLRGVVGWGGYADVERVFRFGLTGEHEWEGTTYRARPDPYGRWIAGANSLSLGRANGDRVQVAQALRALASEAGDRRIRAGDPMFDPMKTQLRARLPPGEREVFDVFAPPADQLPDPVAANALLEEIVPIMRREIPLIEPLPRIHRIGIPVRLLHGRGDLVVPFTETYRAGRLLASRAPDLTTRVTGLFAHSKGDAAGNLVGRARESLRFVDALRRIFELA